MVKEVSTRSTFLTDQYHSKQDAKDMKSKGKTGFSGDSFLSSYEGEAVVYEKDKKGFFTRVKNTILCRRDKSDEDVLKELKEILEFLKKDDRSSRAIEKRFKSLSKKSRERVFDYLKNEKDFKNQDKLKKAVKSAIIEMKKGDKNTSDSETESSSSESSSSSEDKVSSSEKEDSDSSSEKSTESSSKSERSASTSSSENESASIVSSSEDESSSSTSTSSSDEDRKARRKKSNQVNKKGTKKPYGSKYIKVRGSKKKKKS